MLRDTQGDVIPLGKTSRKIEETFLNTTTLPSWLAFSPGSTGVSTYRIVGIEEDYGYFEMKTDALTNSGAKLSIFPNGINFNNIKEVIIELNSVVFSSGSSLEFFFQFANPTSFVSLRSLPAYAKKTVLDIRNDSAGVRDVKNINHYPIIDLDEYKRKRNFSIRLRNDGTFVLESENIVVAEYKMSTAQFNKDRVYFPELTIKTVDSNAKWMRFSRIAATIIHN